MRTKKNWSLLPMCQSTGFDILVNLTGLAPKRTNLFVGFEL